MALSVTESDGRKPRAPSPHAPEPPPRPLVLPPGVVAYRVDPLRRPEQWHALRRQYITASEVAVLFDRTVGEPGRPQRYLHPFKRRVDVMREKLHPKPERAPDPFLLAGRRYEYYAARQLQDMHPRSRVHDVSLFLVSERFGIGATPERIWDMEDGRRSHVEFKCPSYWEWSPDYARADRKKPVHDWSKSARTYARIQTLVCGMLLGTDTCHVAACQRSGAGPGEFALHEVPRDKSLENEIKRLARRFKRELLALEAKAK